MSWQPTKIKLVDRALATATDAVRVKTDAGYGFLKALGNHGGPHLLAADWIGTRLAAWLGLPVFETAIIEVGAAPEIPFVGGGKAAPGPAFIAKELPGHVWSGQAEELERLVNPEDIPRLVVFDTWTRNPDRYPPDPAARRPNLNNVFLAEEKRGRLRLIAMDHTHCFGADRDLGPRTARIEFVQDEQVFGLFPAFGPYLVAHPEAVRAALRRLGQLDRGWEEGLVSALPEAWEVDGTGRAGLTDFVCRRAEYVASHFISLLPEALRPAQRSLL